MKSVRRISGLCWVIQHKLCIQEKKKKNNNQTTSPSKEKNKQTKTTTLVFWGKKEKKRCYNIRPDYGEIQSILAADSVCVSLPAAYFDKQSRRWG